MLERLRIRIGMYASDELDVLRKLEQPQQYDLTVKLTNQVMGEFGHLTQPKEPRFDKTRISAAVVANSSATAGLEARMSRLRSDGACYFPGLSCSR